MVAHTPTALPTLSAEDQSLLLRYFAEDPLPFPEGGGRGVGSSSPASHPIPAPSPLGTQDSAPSPSLLSLYAFLSRPDIAAWVAFHREHQAHLQKQLALTQLTAVCKSSDNLIEKRRAATTLLRALNSSPTQPRRATGPPLDTVPRVPITPDKHAAPSRESLNPPRIPHPPHLPAANLQPTNSISQLLSLQGSTVPRPTPPNHPVPHPATLQPDSS